MGSGFELWMFSLKMKTLRGVSWPHKFLKANKCNIEVKISLTPLWRWFVIIIIILKLLDIHTLMLLLQLIINPV